MQRKETLSEYLCHSLREKVISGRIPFGSTLSSIMGLNELHHVGVRTVRDVMVRLKQESYIKTEKQKSMTAMYRQDRREQKSAAIRYIIENQHSLRDICATMTLIMPRILSFSVQVYSGYTLHRLEKKVKEASAKNVAFRWETDLKFFHALLDQTHNMFFRNLFSSLELYARPTFFFQEEQFSGLQNSFRFQNILWVQEAIYSRQLTENMNKFTQMYATVQKTVGLQIQELCRQSPHVKQTEKPFLWHSDRERDHLHTQITKDLVDKIGTGKLVVGTQFPSETEPASQYRVSVTTIRKALASLNELGYAGTWNVKGTTVCMQDGDIAAKCVQTKAYREDTLHYLSGLQLMILFMEPATSSAFPFISAKALLQLQCDLQDKNRIPLDCLMALVRRYVPLKTLQTLMTELGKILCQGCYYPFYPQKQHGSTVLNRKSMEAVKYLLEGNQGAFSRQLYICYARILDIVRSDMIGLKLFEASHMIAPKRPLLQKRGYDGQERLVFL